MADFPEKLYNYLGSGAPGLVITIGADELPNTAYTWVVASDRKTARFAVDQQSNTQINLEGNGRCAIQIIGPENLLFLIKGQAHFISDPIEMASLSVLIAEMSEMQIKDQSWKGVSVTPLAYQWPAGQSKRMEKMEDALFDQMRIELQPHQ